VWIFPILVLHIRHLDSIFDRIGVIPCLLGDYRGLTPEFLPWDLISFRCLQILVIVVLLYDVLFRFTQGSLSDVACDF
jgi:hypothetical protein